MDLGLIELPDTVDCFHFGPCLSKCSRNIASFLAPTIRDRILVFPRSSRRIIVWAGVCERLETQLDISDIMHAGSPRPSEERNDKACSIKGSDAYRDISVQCAMASFPALAPNSGFGAMDFELAFIFSFMPLPFVTNVALTSCSPQRPRNVLLAWERRVRSSPYKGQLLSPPKSLRTFQFDVCVYSELGSWISLVSRRGMLASKGPIAIRFRLHLLKGESIPLPSSLRDLLADLPRPVVHMLTIPLPFQCHRSQPQYQLKQIV